MNKSILSLLNSLKSLGAKLYLEEGNLKISIKEGLLTKEIADTIRSNKNEIISLLSESKSSDFLKVEKVAINSSYALSPAQFRFWVLSQFEEGSAAYNMTNFLRLENNYDIESFKRAVWSVLERHEILRTVFREDDEGNIRQMILSISELEFEIGSESYLEEEDPEQCARVYIKNDIFIPFDLAKPPLIRACLLRLTADTHVFYYTMHHIISDGWSVNIFARDILAYYKHYAEGVALELPELRIQYKDYAAWQLKQLRGQGINTHRDYWMNKFSGKLPVLGLPNSKKRPLVNTNNGRTLSTYLDKATTKEIKSYIKANGGTLFMFCLASLKVLFHRYTGQEDIIIGSPIAGRNNAEFKDQIGAYLNTLALRNTISGEMSFDTFYENVKQNLIDAYSHQIYPFDRLVEDLELKRDVSRNAIFDVIMDLVNLSDSKEMQDLSIKEVEQIKDQGTTMSKFDLTFDFTETKELLGIGVTYNTDVYDFEELERFLKHYKEIVKNIVVQSKRAIGVLEFLSAAERNKLLHDFNNTNVSYPKDKTIVDLFEEQVKARPENIALSFGAKNINYQELNERANQLAHYLIKEGVGKESLIGICINRSVDMIVGILGIIKSGAAYVPIDPVYPEDRINYILKDSACNFVLTNKESKSVLAGATSTKLISLDEEASQINKQSNTNLSIKIDPSNLIYVIYTSGTTGKPKGVLLEHENLVRLFVNDQALFDFNEKDVWTMFHSFCFDFSVWEMYGALLNGGRLVLVSEETQKDTAAYANLLETEGVTILNQTPTAFNVLQEQVLQENLSLKLRSVIFGGEALNPSLLAQWNNRYPDCQLINMYGITETTVHVTYKEITKTDIEKEKSNIGKPIPTLTCYVLNQQGKLAPFGIEGELYVEGAGVARGYLNRPKLTEERFISNPFDGGESRLYRTGDLAKWLPNGDLEYLGRIDDQVKIRGHRIELREIENVLLSKKEVSNCVVLKKTAEADHLVAYYICSSMVEVSELRNFLRERLPAYMIPNYFVALEDFPLTLNGKIDKNALPDVNALTLLREVPYEAPKGEKEKALVQVWESVLKRNKISIHDSFYDLGGDSIKSIQVASRLKQLGYELKVSDLLRTPILSNLAPKLNRVRRKIDQSVVEGEVLLNPIQRSFLLSKNHPKKSYFNQSVMLESAEAIDIDLLEKSLAHLVNHHDALRMVYKETRGSWSQENKGLNHKGYSIDYKDFRGGKDYKTDLEVACNKLQSSINIEEGPLLKAGLFRLEEKDCILLVIHHLVVDGVSWRIFLEDLETVYGNLKKEKPLVLPLKTDSFQRWTLLLDEYAKSEKLEKEKPYWENLLSTELSPLNKKETHQGIKKGNLKNAEFSLSREIVELLQTKTHRVYSTEINDVLLTALGLAIQKVYGNDRVIVEMEGHGREGIIEEVDISRTIGWFTSVYPFLLSTGEDASDFRSSLMEVKESLRKLPNKGIGYGILRYMGSSFEKELEADILFNYLGDFGEGTKDNKNELFVFSDEEGGAFSSELNDDLGTKLNVSGMLINGVLNMNVSYNDLYYLEDDISVLMASYKSVLNTIILELSKDTERHLTPSDLTYKGLSIPALSILNENNNVEDVYRLSPLQEGMYFHLVSGAGKGAYFCQNNYRLKIGEASISNIEKSYGLLIDRHAALRTGFNGDQEDILQVVRKKVENTFYYENISSRSQSDKEAYLADFKKKDLNRGFTLEQDSLIRLSVIDLGENIYEFIWSNHHILMDGWCVSILINEFYQILMSLEQKAAISLPPVIPYSLYIQWLDDLDQTSSKSYWQNYLTEYKTKTSLPFKTLPVLEQEFLPMEKKMKIGPSDLDKLKQVCAEYNLTENTFLQTVWGYLLSLYNNTDDVVYGSVVSGRPGEIAGVEDMIGLFINTIPVRVQYTDEMTVTDLLKARQEEAIAGMDHHYLSLAEIHSVGGLGSELFDHIYLFQNYAINELDAEVGGSEGLVEKMTYISGENSEQTHYDLILLVFPDGGSLEIKFDYNGHVYQEESIEQLGDHFLKAISYFLDNPQMPLKNASCLPKEELEEVHRFIADHVDKESLIPASFSNGILERETYVAPRSEVERKLVELWEKVLQIDNIGITENFFELGGHSIKLVKLVNSYHRIFNVKLEIETLFKITTIEKHAELIEVDSWLETKGTKHSETISF